MSFNHFALAEIAAKQGDKRAARRSYHEAYALAPANPLYLIALIEAEKWGGSSDAVAQLSKELQAAIAEERIPERLHRRAEAALKAAPAK